MTYKACIDWLFSQFPAYQNVGISAYKPDLDNVLELCSFFEVDYSKLKFVHVAGTNGKGSTSNYLASILQEAGYKTGLFTSPHILDFRERIRVNGEMISEAKVIDFCNRIQKSKIKNQKSKIQPSFFEITWVLALIHFLDSNCEICVIETGMGGRLDATNIIHPLLSIITSIGLDHTAILGDTIEKIAFEKAGIIKKNVPIILGDISSSAKQVITEKAQLENSTTHYYEDFKIDKSMLPADSYLYKNESVVRKTCELLNISGFSISDEQVESGIKKVSKNTGFKGRFQLISEKPFILVDAAHNVDGIIELLKLIAIYPQKKLLVIYGASNDKNVEEIIQLFPENTEFLFTCFTNQRSLNLNQLAELSKKISYKSSIFPNINEAFKCAKNTQDKEDIILITGSFFLLGDFFSFFERK